MWILAHRRLVSYGGAAATVGTAALLTATLPPLDGQSTPPLFLGAVALAAWLGGLGPGLLATCLSLLAIDFFFVPPIYAFGLAAEGSVRLAAFAAVAFLISALQKPRGRFLIVCAACRRVRDRRGAWVRVETYLRCQAGIECSHGLCPECGPKIYPEAFPAPEGRDHPGASGRRSS
jgi:hypothetical protein